MRTTGQGALGLIAGEGNLPVQGARYAREVGRALVCVAFQDLADPCLAESADEILWIQPGEVARGLAFLREHGVREAVLAGKVAKQGLFGDRGALLLDETARSLLGDLPDLSDVKLFEGVAAVLEQAGISLLPQWSLDPALRVGVGPLGKVSPSDVQQRDIEFGLPIARGLAGQGIGQSIVVKQGVVLAVEAVEGTDAALRRAGALTKGGVAIKVARPGQDPRFDLPVIGPRTVEILRASHIAVLAFEAEATLVLDRDRLVREADAADIAVVGAALPGRSRGAP